MKEPGITFPGEPGGGKQGVAFYGRLFKTFGMELFGSTRIRVTARHALIAEDGYVPGVFPGWKGSAAFVHLSPAMGSLVTQMTVVFDEDGGQALFPAGEHEHVFYVESGELTWNGKSASEGNFVFIPAATKIVLKGKQGSRVTVFRKVYDGISRLKKPEVVTGSVEDISGEPFLGNEDIRLQRLLPTHDRFDLAVNIFTYEPGAALSIRGKPRHGAWVEDALGAGCLPHGGNLLSGKGGGRDVDGGVLPTVVCSDGH